MSEDQESTIIPEQEEQPVIYCGPTLPRQYGLLQYGIFNGIPDHVQQVIDQYPVIGKLIIPVDQLAQIRIAIATKGSVQSAFYQQIVAEFTVKAVKK